MDWYDFYESLQPDLESLSTSVAPQFGSREGPFLFARLLPERVRNDVYDLTFTETAYGFISTPALDNTRYSPVQFGQTGMELVEVSVTMGHTDIANQLTARDHDGIVNLLQSANTIEASARAIQWASSTLVDPHAIKNEIQRADGILTGTITREAINGYTESITIPGPSGQRPIVPGGTVASPAGWNDPDYPILNDILAGQRWLAANGYSVTDSYATTELLSLMKGNTTLANMRGGVIVADGGGTVSVISRDLSDTELNDLMASNSLPGVTKYDTGYRKPRLVSGVMQKVFRKFMEPTTTHHYFLMVGNTGRSEELAGNGQPVLTLSNTLGYYALGRNPGQSVWGRTIYTEVMPKKPIGLYGESYQTGFPVIANTDAFYVIRVAKPT